MLQSSRPGVSSGVGVCTHVHRSQPWEHRSRASLEGVEIRTQENMSGFECRALGAAVGVFWGI